MECQLRANTEKCNCTYNPCSRKGRCCECIAYHLQAEELPACAFPDEVERTYDRSFTRFVIVFNEKKTGG
jgi:hypothetical protein